MLRGGKYKHKENYSLSLPSLSPVPSDAFICYLRRQSCTFSPIFCSIAHFWKILQIPPWWAPASLFLPSWSFIEKKKKFSLLDLLVSKIVISRFIIARLCVLSELYRERGLIGRTRCLAGVHACQCGNMTYIMLRIGCRCSVMEVWREFRIESAKKKKPRRSSEGSVA